MPNHQTQLVIAIALASAATAFLMDSASAPADTAADLAGKDFEIRLDRKFQIGDKLQFTASVSDNRNEKIFSGEKVVEDNQAALTVRMTADAKILAVNTAGQITRAQYTIRSFTGAISGQAAPTVAQGTVLIAESLKGETFLRPTRGKLPMDARELVALAISLESAEDRIDDPVFGTAGRKKVGQSWPVNAAKMAAFLARERMAVKPADIQGAMTLKGVRTIAAAPCLLIQGTVTIKRFKPPLPHGAKLTGAAMTMTFGGDFPVDTSLPRFGETSTMKMNAKMTMTTSKGKIRMDMARSQTSKRNYVPAAAKTVNPKIARPATKPASGKNGNETTKSQPTVDEDGATLELPEPCRDYVLAGGGRYFIFHLKTARKIAVADIRDGKIILEIPNMPDGVRVAGAAAKMVILSPAQRMMQSWDLTKMKRDRVARIPVEGELKTVLMGSTGKGPLLVTTPSEAVLVDLGTLQTIRVKGKVIGATGRYGQRVCVSADGRTFTSIATGLSGQRYTRMEVTGRTTTLGTFGLASHVFRWAQPTADGSLMFTPGGGIVAASLRSIPVKWPAGTQCFPTTDPAFFLAVRFDRLKSGGLGDQPVMVVDICTVADRLPIYTLTGFGEMAPQGNTSSRNSTGRAFAGGARTVHWFPAEKRMAVLSWDGTKLFLERFDLEKALAEDGKKYLFVVSAPPTVAKAGRIMTYRIQVRSQAGGVKYSLASGPKGAIVTPRGIVRWKPSRYAKESTAVIIIRIVDSSGTEMFHTIDLALTNLFRKQPPVRQ